MSRFRQTLFQPTILFLGVCFALQLFLSNPIKAQDSIKNTALNRFLTASPTYNKKRVAWLSGSLGVSYVGSMTGLYYLWYAGYPQSNFHIFNDNKEWLQIDKGGHLISSYYIGMLGKETMHWAGMNRPLSVWFGGSFGSIFLLTVEVFDGFSQEWGFSWGDIIANSTGTATYIGQELLWKEQRFTWKISYADNYLAHYRPDLLGSSPIQRLLKDYNGLTYWLSGNIHSFLPESSGFPRWLSVGVGYGASGMLGAHYNPATDPDGNPLPSVDRFRQYYLTLDIDLWRIKTRSKVLRTLFSAIRIIKIPTPTLEFNSNAKGKVRFYGMYPFF
ncbi:MAG: YfiM family protein [Bacteroidia bacterium]|nr:YfiM family protein [Bacteroidia bacterium]